MDGRKGHGADPRTAHDQRKGQNRLNAFLPAVLLLALGLRWTILHAGKRHELTAAQSLQKPSKGLFHAGGRGTRQAGRRPSVADRRVGTAVGEPDDTGTIDPEQFADPGEPPLDLAVDLSVREVHKGGGEVG